MVEISFCPEFENAFSILVFCPYTLAFWLEVYLYVHACVCISKTHPSLPIVKNIFLIWA